MAAKPTVLVDLNVILDVLQHRGPHYAASAIVWSAVETRQIRGLIAAHSITTLFYLLARHHDAVATHEVIDTLLTVFSVAKVDQHVIKAALAFRWRDFEDAVQMIAASEAGADYLITRNPKDFKGGPVPVLQPAELPAILQQRP